MPDEILPTATHFMIAPKQHPEKGITTGTESGTCLLLPSQFAHFRRTKRIHELEVSSLVLRETVVLDVPTGSRGQIAMHDIETAFGKVDFRKNDAVLIRTGWGDGAPSERCSDSYILDTPRLSREGIDYLINVMHERQSDLLLTDLALLSYPNAHLIPEWTTMQPRPLSYPSEAARAYLQGYLEREVHEDWDIDYALAEAGIMTVKRLVNCGAIRVDRLRIIVAPIRLVRGIGSPCRVVAIAGKM
jgi:kynurenine formamidase